MASTGLLDLAALCALVHKSVGKVQRQFFQCECSLTLALSVQRLNRGQKCTSLVCCDPCWRACVFFLLLFFWGGGVTLHSPCVSYSNALSCCMWRPFSLKRETLSFLLRLLTQVSCWSRLLRCAPKNAPKHAAPCTRRELAQRLVQKCRRTQAAQRQIEGRSAGGFSCTGKSSARVLHRPNWCRKCSQIEETKSWLANGKKKSADTFHNTASCLFLLPTPFVTADSYTIA